MKSTIRLFKALPTHNKAKKTNDNLLKDTIRRGFVFSPEVVAFYPESELRKLMIGLTPEELNSSFHKSWEKVKSADIEQLVIEQITHYLLKSKV